MTTNNVIKLKVIKTYEPDAKKLCDAILKEAKGNLTECLIVGFDEDGELYAKSTEGPGDTMFLLEFAKKWLLEGCPE